MNYDQDAIFLPYSPIYHQISYEEWIYQHYFYYQSPPYQIF